MGTLYSALEGRLKALALKTLLPLASSRAKLGSDGHEFASPSQPLGPE